MGDKQRGINRVIMSCWDLDVGIAFYGDTLGATFYESVGGEAASFGVRAAMSWDAGIELVAPLPGRDSDVKTRLENDGEGIIGVVFAVADADASKAAFAERGIGTYYSLDYDQEIIDARLEGRFTQFKEHFLEAAAPLSGTVLIGEFELRRRPQLGR